MNSDGICLSTKRRKTLPRLAIAHIGTVRVSLGAMQRLSICYHYNEGRASPETSSVSRRLLFLEIGQVPEWVGWGDGRREAR